MKKVRHGTRTDSKPFVVAFSRSIPTTWVDPVFRAHWTVKLLVPATFHDSKYVQLTDFEVRYNFAPNSQDGVGANCTNCVSGGGNSGQSRVDSISLLTFVRQQNHW